MIKSSIKQRIPECVTVYRDKPQYPSWPAPVRRFVCSCGVKLTLAKSGRAEVRHCIAWLWDHLHDGRHRRWEDHRAGVRRLPLRKSRRISTLKASDAEAQRIKWREQKRAQRSRRRSTLKHQAAAKRAR